MGRFRKVYGAFIEEIIKYLDHLKQNMVSHIQSQANKGAPGRDMLNEPLIYNTAELVMLLLELDIVEIVFEEEANGQYMRLVEPLMYLIQYERKFMKYLNGSIKSLKEEVEKRKKKKDEKNNPMAGISLPGALSFSNMMSLVQKKEKAEDAEDDNGDEMQQVQSLDDAQLFQNPIMRGFISINHTLESLTYQEYWKIKTEIEFKLKVCSIFDYFLDRRQNFLISNILVFFKNRVLTIEDEPDKSQRSSDNAQESQEQKMIKLVSDYMLGLIPNVARTGIKTIDEPEKHEEDPFAFMNLKKLANLKNMFDEKKPEQFTNYFHFYKIDGFMESFDLDQYLSLNSGDPDLNNDPIASALPYLLNVFFFVHDEYLEERCLNVIMRIFNQRDELSNNLKQIQILFDDEKRQLFQFIDKVMIQLTELIERSEIWLSEFMKKTSMAILEIDQIQKILRNLTMGFQFNIRVKDDEILLMKEADQEQNKIDPDKQSIMNFLNVHIPVIDLIKNGFHVLVDVVLDPMFPENKKEQIIILFTNAYSFLTAFVKDNTQNQQTLY